MRRIVAALVVAILLPLEGQAEEEKAHISKWCQEKNGITEYPLYDGTKVDCLTDTHAIEFEHATGWGKVVGSLGQAIHYAQLANRRPGIILIVEHINNCRYLKRLEKTVEGVLVNGKPVDLLQSIGSTQCPQ